MSVFVDTWIDKPVTKLSISGDELMLSVRGTLRKDAFIATYECAFGEALILIAKGLNVPTKAPAGSIVSDVSDGADLNII